MLSKSACRATRSASSIPSNAVASSLPILSATRPCSHQRRTSSSKTSYPRGSEQAANSTSSSPAEDDKQSSSRLPRRRAKDATNQSAMTASDEPFANLPAVPSTTHLNLGDVKISSFFSQHRPISVHSPFPTGTTPAAFASIFDSRTSSPAAGKIANVTYTLNPAYFSDSSSSSSAQSRDEKDLRWEVLQQSASHADPQGGRPDAAVLEQLVRQFRPFNTPPPPVPFEHDDDAAAAPAAATEPPAAAASPPRRRRQRFLARRANGPRGMLLISVKRQRRLKMKKHKLKKLMRRTRNLRRKEGKI